MSKKSISLDSEQPHLILCEGIDAYFFMIWFLDDIKKQEQQFSSFKVYDFGGIKQLTSYLTSLTKIGEFEDIVKSITIIRDAETNAAGTCRSIQYSLRSLGFAEPDSPCTPKKDTTVNYPDITTGFLLFPTCSEKLENGTLEDLCLNILQKENASSILDNADKALKSCNTEFSCPHKNRLHTFFSLTDEYVSLKLGEAAKCKAFSYNAPEIKSLKDFLEKMQQ